MQTSHQKQCNSDDNGMHFKVWKGKKQTQNSKSGKNII